MSSISESGDSLGSSGKDDDDDGDDDGDSRGFWLFDEDEEDESEEVSSEGSRDDPRYMLCMSPYAGRPHRRFWYGG